MSLETDRRAWLASRQARIKCEAGAAVGGLLPSRRGDDLKVKATHVVASGRVFRTWVQFPPPPPFLISSLPIFEGSLRRRAEFLERRSGRVAQSAHLARIQGGRGGQIAAIAIDRLSAFSTLAMKVPQIEPGAKDFRVTGRRQLGQQGLELASRPFASPRKVVEHGNVHRVERRSLGDELPAAIVETDAVVESAPILIHQTEQIDRWRLVRMLSEHQGEVLLGLLQSSLPAVEGGQ